MKFVLGAANKAHYSITRGLFLFFSSLLLMVSGCGGGGGNNPPKIVGTWRQVQVSQGHAIENCPGFVFFPDGTQNTCGENDTYTFRSDGTFSETKGYDTLTGTYSQSGGAIRVKVDNLEGAIPVDFSGNNIMILTYTVGGELYRDFLQRQ